MDLISRKEAKAQGLTRITPASLASMATSPNAKRATASAQSVPLVYAAGTMQTTSKPTPKRLAIGRPIDRYNEQPDFLCAAAG